jgi:hypothetical protein
MWSSLRRLIYLSLRAANVDGVYARGNSVYVSRKNFYRFLLKTGFFYQSILEIFLLDMDRWQRTVFVEKLSKYADCRPGSATEELKRIVDDLLADKPIDPTIEVCIKAINLFRESIGAETADKIVIRLLTRENID